MITSVQRFGGALNLHVHFHTLALDGVFVREPDATLRFHPVVPPTDDDVRRMVTRVRRRLERLRLVGVTATDEDADALADESAALAGLSQAAVLGRAALGAGPDEDRCGSVPIRTRRGSSATCRCTPTMPGSIFTRPCTSPPAIARGSSGSADISFAHRSRSTACSGCVTGESP